MWVIFAMPQAHRGPNNRFVAKDGTKTDSRTLAARFYTHGDAQEFAKEKNIKLDGAMTYIGQLDFTEFELQQD
jgi:hypothetical protein